MKNMTCTSVGLRGETDFLRRQNNRIVQKQKKLKSIKLKGIHLLFIFVLLSFIAFAIYKTGQFVLTWDKLNVKSFRLTNCPKTILKEVKGVLSRYSGNILTFSLKDLRTQLVDIPEVQEVSINRILPSTIEIKFLLRKPVFQVEMNGDGKYNIFDQEGVVLFKNVKKRIGLITVKNIENSPQEQEKIISYLSQLDSIKNDIDYVSLKEPYGILLKLKGISETFYPGETNFAKKINDYLKVRRKLSLNINQNNSKIRNVDLRFEDRFYLEYEYHEEVSR
jgi:cell division septal protein FtsQ